MESSYYANGTEACHPQGGFQQRQGVPVMSSGAHLPSLPSFGTIMADSSLLLSQFDIPDQVRQIITDGPGNSPETYYTYLQCLDKLREQAQFLERALRSSRELIAMATSTLQRQFDEMLKANSISPDPEELKAAMLSDTAPDHIRPPEVLRGTAIDQLHNTAQRLVDNGLGSTCSRLYRECRGTALQRNFDAMQVLRLTERQVQDMPWTELERNMQKWNEHMHIGMIFIAAEREACDLVLDELEPIREQCFVDLSRPCMSLLTGFGLAVAGTKQSPEKLFALLDMYETALDLHQTVEELFAGNEGSPVRREYARLLSSLGNAARETFEKFEEAVKEQPTLDEADEAASASSPGGPSRGRQGPGHSNRITAANLQSMRGGKNFFGKLRKKGGARGRDDDAATDVGSVASTAAGAACASGKVHPLASYVINYVIILCNGDLPYFANLEHAVGEAVGANQGSSSDTASVSTTSASGQTRVQFKIAFAMKRILEALQTKLEARAAAMGDDVLAELFLMNNFAYILTKIEMSDAGRLLGVAWCGECAVLVDKHRDKYIKNALARFDPIFAEAPSLDVPILLKRLRTFNSYYEKLRQRQLSWSIPNPELREYVRNAVSKGLVDRYSTFLTKAGPLIQQQKFVDVNIMSCREVADGLQTSFSVGPGGRGGSRS